MDSSLLIAAGASFAAGLLGYLVARLWMKPIVHYNIAKHKLDHELTHYLVQLEESSGPEKQAAQKHDRATLQTARKHAMDLVSCYGSDIPYWYRLLLESRKESPTQATGLLTNLSKIRDMEQVKNRIDYTRKIIIAARFSKNCQNR